MVIILIGMKIFLSFRYTGESRDELQKFFYPLRDKLISYGHEVYLSLDDLITWDSSELTVREKFAKTFRELETSDALVVVVRTGDKSEGMLMEVGFALALPRPIYLYVAKGIDTYIREVATSVIEFTGHEDLLASISL